MRIRTQYSNLGPSLAIHTPAKLNLYLDVLGRRSDGFHELETVMVSIGLYDSLLFKEDESHQTRLRCHSAAPPFRAAAPLADGSNSLVSNGPDNLVHRAANLIRQRTGCDRGVTIELWKRIPLQAGLGGGSSDAAATLVGLNRLWNLGLSSSELHQLAAQLGSDVNFFLDSPIAAACRGRGEMVTPLRLLHRLHFVVVCPATGLSTADVFRNLDSRNLDTHQRDADMHKADNDDSKGISAFIHALQAGRIGVDGASMNNALEAPARSLNQDVGRTLDVLCATGASSVLMSGSGTSCFAVCNTSRQARFLARRLRWKSIGRVDAVDACV